MRSFIRNSMVVIAVLLLGVNMSCTKITYKQKMSVEICHNGTPIVVDLHAVVSHLNHGDQLGTCN